MSRTRIRQQARSALARMIRPGVAPIEARLDGLVDRLAREPIGAVWRGGLDGAASLPDGSHSPISTDRMRRELRYWVRAAKNLDGEFEDGLEGTFRRWQRIRLYELARCLEMEGGLQVGGTLTGAFGDWLGRQRAVEIGGGPWPCVAAARFASATVVDPLADGYRAEGLITPEAERVQYLAAAGEAIPVVTGGADLVITDNCLDHVQDPERVAGEMSRVLRPGGLLWLLVDVMDHADELHPHPMSESTAAELLRNAGLEQRWGEVWDGHSHPRAKGQWRTLWAKPAGETSGRRGGEASGG